VYASHGRSISSGPEDWPPFALRRSEAIQRYSRWNSSIGLNGEPLVRPSIIQFNPPPAMSNNGKPEPNCS
jgi:hypothetical protein